MEHQEPVVVPKVPRREEETVMVRSSQEEKEEETAMVRSSQEEKEEEEEEVTVTVREALTGTVELDL